MFFGIILLSRICSVIMIVNDKVCSSVGGILFSLNDSCSSLMIVGLLIWLSRIEDIVIFSCVLVSIVGSCLFVWIMVMVVVLFCLVSVLRWL